MQSLNIDLIDNLVSAHEEMERRSLKSHKLLHEMTSKMCEYFAMKDVVHKQMNEIVVANPTLRKFAEMLSNPDKGSNNELLPIVSDIINNGKSTGKQWSDSTKTLFALIMDFGGPALASQVQETMSGPSLTTLYKTVRLPYAIPQNIESPSFSRARASFDRLGIQGPFILAVDATPVILALKVRGNRIYGIAKDDVIVRTAEDIIKIAGDKSLPKTKLVNAFVLAPVYVSNPFYVLALSPVKEGETSETVAFWCKEAVRMGLDNNVHIIGIGADRDSKFRKFFLDKYTKGNEQNNGLTLDYESFDVSSETKQFGTLLSTTVMQPD